jgi:DNA-binding NtrC family response regulator
MDSPSVLVVGSDPECRRTLGNVFGQWGVEGIFVSTISDARKILLEQSIGLVFCESHLPDGGFTDLLDAAASKTFPVRLVAILHDGNEYANAIRLGAFEAILVPCQRSDIQWAIIQARHAEQKSPPDLEGLRNPEDSVQGSIPETRSSLPSQIAGELHGCRTK